jgi:hypothetical protein
MPRARCRYAVLPRVAAAIAVVPLGICRDHQKTKAHRFSGHSKERTVLILLSAVSLTETCRLTIYNRSIVRLPNL